MKILDCEQGSAEWIHARLGIPTASQFGRIVTPARKQLAAGRREYMAELIVEWVQGVPYDDFESEWTERGQALEPQAREYYGFECDMDPREVGLCLTDNGLAGATPDALVGDDGLLEIKCPMAKNHLLHLAGGVVPTKHIAQVQGQLWVTGRKWCDWMSYHDQYPSNC